MLKKQHKRSSNDKMIDRQQGRGVPFQSGSERDEVGGSPAGNEGAWGEGQDVGRSLDSSEGIERDEDLGAGRQGGQGRSPRNQARGRLDEDYEENTEIRRETEFRDATGHPLDPDAGGPKVTRDNDVFGREEEK